MTDSEEARMNKRMIDRAERTVVRERNKLQTMEKKLLAEIKGLAKQSKHVETILTGGRVQPKSWSKTLCEHDIRSMFTST